MAEQTKKKNGEREGFGGCGGEIWREGGIWMISVFFFFFFLNFFFKFDYPIRYNTKHSINNTVNSPILHQTPD